MSEPSFENPCLSFLEMRQKIARSRSWQLMQFLLQKHSLCLICQVLHDVIKQQSPKLDSVKHSVSAFVKKYATTVATEDAARVKKKLSELSKSFDSLFKQVASLRDQSRKIHQRHETEKANDVSMTNIFKAVFYGII